MPFDEEDEFEAIFEEDLDLSGAVGEGEIYLRKQMGNERFEQLMHFQTIQQINGTALDAQNVRRLSNLADAWASADRAIKVATLLATAWSVYYWFFGRVSK